MRNPSIRSASVVGRQLHAWFSVSLLVGGLGLTSCTRDLCEGGGCQTDGVVGSLMTARVHTSSKVTAEVSSAPAETTLAPTATASPTVAATGSGSVGVAPSASVAAPVACTDEGQCSGEKPRCLDGECAQCDTSEYCRALDRGLIACVAGSCVECLGDGDCKDGKVCDGRGVCAACDSAERHDSTGLSTGFAGCGELEVCLRGDPASANACVGCRDAADCNGQQCDPVAHECAACIADTNVGCGVDAPRCLAGDTVPANSCVQCLTRDDCAGSAATECDPVGHVCVACLAEPGETPPALTDGGVVQAVDWGCAASVPRCLVGTAVQSSQADAAVVADASQPADASASAGGTATGDNGSAPELRECVECITSADCSGVCDLQRHICVQCTSSADCGGDRAQCDAPSGQCVECDPQEHDADGVNPDCEHVGGKDVCSSAGTCVECAGVFDSACGAKVCDDRPPAAEATTNTQHTCVAPKANSATACEECVSDAQCQPGQACVLTPFQDTGIAVGYHCLYRKVDAADLPGGYVAADDRDAYGVKACSSEAVPYVLQLATTSVSGLDETFCAPSRSTCLALQQYRDAAECQSDDECGVAGITDAKCAVVEGNNRRCSPICNAANQCPVDANGGNQGCHQDGYCKF